MYSFVQCEQLSLCQRTTHVDRSGRDNETKSHKPKHRDTLVSCHCSHDKSVTSSHDSVSSTVRSNLPLWLSCRRMWALPSPSLPSVTTTAKRSSSSSYSTIRKVYILSAKKGNNIYKKVWFCSFLNAKIKQVKNHLGTS